MPRIVFHVLKWKNFLSYGANETTVQLDKDSITLIGGKNGHGKSAIINALSFALFGKSISGVNKSGLINNKNKKNMIVSVEFSVGKDRYEIIRCVKPDGIVFKKNGRGEEIEGDSREFQKRLEKDILKFDIKGFKQLVCLGIDYVRFFNMNALERRLFVEGILDLNLISKMSDIFKEQRKKAKTEIDKIDIEVGNREVKINTYTSEKEKHSLRDSNSITKLANEQDELTLENRSLEKKIEILKPSLLRISNDTEELKKELQEKNNLLTKYSNNLTLISSERTESKKLLSFFKEHTQCPTCGQNIDEDFVQNQIKKHESIIIKKDSEEKEFLTAIDNVNKEKKDIDDILYKFNDEQQKVNSEISQYQTNINVNKNRIIKITSDIEQYNKENLSQDYDNIIFGLQTEIKDFIEKRNKFSKNLEITETCLEVLSDTGVKSAIIANYISFINERLSIYLERFSFPFEVTLDQDFNDIILMDFREPVTYANLSAGQRGRLDFSMLMVWRDIAKIRNTTSTNLLSIDEVFDASFDDDGIRDMIDVLKSEDSNSFIISHKDVKSLFDHVLEIRKEEFGFSELVEL